MAVGNLAKSAIFVTHCSSELENTMNPDQRHLAGAGAGGAKPGVHGSAASVFNNSAFNNVPQGLHGHYRQLMIRYWQNVLGDLENEEHDFKVHQLPLARIKKVMKSDEDVKMISAEAPILFAKGCDIFITELTMRAWIHAEENKRRTLQRSDIACALSKSDMFDFLIDIVPREEEIGASHAAPHPSASQGAPSQAQRQHSQQQDFRVSRGINQPEQTYQGHTGDQRLYANMHNPGSHGYGGQPMYNEMENMYAYPQIPPQV